MFLLSSTQCSFCLRLDRHRVLVLSSVNGNVVCLHENVRSGESPAISGPFYLTNRQPVMCFVLVFHARSWCWWGAQPSCPTHHGLLECKRDDSKPKAWSGRLFCGRAVNSQVLLCVPRKKVTASGQVHGVPGDLNGRP